MSVVVDTMMQKHLQNCIFVIELTTFRPHHSSS